MNPNTGPRPAAEEVHRLCKEANDAANAIRDLLAEGGELTPEVDHCVSFVAWSWDLLLRSGVRCERVEVECQPRTSLRRTRAVTA